MEDCLQNKICFIEATRMKTVFSEIKTYENVDL